MTISNREILERIEQTLEAHTYLLALALQKEIQMADTLDDVVAEADKQTTIEAGMKVVMDHAASLLDEIGAKLAEAGQDPAKLAALRKTIADNSAGLTAATEPLAAAVERNTQSQPSGAA